MRDDGPLLPWPLQSLAEVLHVPFVDERSAIEEWIALRRDPLYAGQGVPHGNGEAVVVVGGFGADQLIMGPLSGWLERIGYEPVVVCHRRGLDCGERTAATVEAAMEDAAARTGGRVGLVAHSRGGQFARVAASRRPDLLAGLVTMGTPFEHFALTLPVRAQAVAIGLAGTLGVRGLVRLSCLRGACCERFRRDLVTPLPPGTPFWSLYSSADSTVRWRTCIDAGAQNVQVPGTHVSMLASRATYRAIATALAQMTLRDEDSHSEEHAHEHLPGHNRRGAPAGR
jgi:pimeloyl-ACP methyl ester carboxylesterase